MPLDRDPNEIMVLVVHSGGIDSVYQELAPWVLHGEGRSYGITLADAPEFHQVHARIAQTHPECVLFDASEDHIQEHMNEKTIRAWRRNSRTEGYLGPGIVGIVKPGDIDAVNWLKKLGVEECYERPADRPGLISQIHHAISTREEVNTNNVIVKRVEVPVTNLRIMAPTVAVVGIGGAGKTTLALNVAALLRFLGNYKTCLVDMAGSNPAVHHFLSIDNKGEHCLPNIIMGLRPESDFLGRQREAIQSNILAWKPPHYHSDAELDLILGYDSYLHVIDDVELRWTTALMEKLMQTLRLPDAYSNLVVDIGDGLHHPGEKGAIRQSNVILIVIPPRRGSVQATGQYVNDLLEILAENPHDPGRTFGAVLNGTGQDGALGERDVRPYLPKGVEFWGSIPWAPLDVENALNANTLPVLFDDNTMFAKAVSGLVHGHVAPLPREIPTNRGLRGWLGRRSA